MERLRFDGLVTLERARLLTGPVGPVEPPEDLHEATKLTIYVGRRERVGSRPAFEAAVDLLHRHRRWFAVVDELTAETGLVTSEIVPAFRATTPRGEHGGLRLAQRWSDRRQA